MNSRNRSIVIGGSIVVSTLVFGTAFNAHPGLWGGHFLSRAQAADSVSSNIVSSNIVNVIPAPMTEDQKSLAAIQPTQAVLAALYDQALPSVVNIQVTLDPNAIQQAQGNPNQGQSPQIPGFPFQFPFPFGGQEQPQTPQDQQPPQNQPMAEGSGFVYDTEGHIVTNNHVVENATKIVVNFANGVWVKGEVVARDPQADLAVIKITPPAGMTLTPLPLAADDALRVGYSVAAVGSPFSLDETLTTGIVSALGRAYATGSEAATSGPHYSLPDVIQTDTAINPGNSGGPLLDMKGEVVGVNFAINSPVRANSGVGFAIPVNVVRKVVPALLKDGMYNYSYLGLSGATVSAWLADEKKLPDSSYGIYVDSLNDGGPADKAGLQAGDLVTAVNDKPLHRFEELLSYLFEQTAPGQSITLHLLRDGKEISLNVVVGARPSLTEQANADTQNGSKFLSAGKAIDAAEKAVSEAGLLSKFDTTHAKRSLQDGKPVWMITLTGDGKTATVIVDAQSGEVTGLEVQR